MTDYPEGDADMAEKIAQAEGSTDAMPVEGEVAGAGTEVLGAEGCEVIVERFDAYLHSNC